MISRRVSVIHSVFQCLDKSRCSLMLHRSDRSKILQIVAMNGFLTWHEADPKGNGGVPGDTDLKTEGLPGRMWAYQADIQ